MKWVSVIPIWVVGFEADFQGALEKDHNTLTNNFTVTGDDRCTVSYFFETIANTV